MAAPLVLSTNIWDIEGDKTFPCPKEFIVYSEGGGRKSDRHPQKAARETGLW